MRVSDIFRAEPPAPALSGAGNRLPRTGPISPGGAGRRPHCRGDTCWRRRLSCLKADRDPSGERATRNPSVMSGTPAADHPPPGAALAQPPAPGQARDCPAERRLRRAAGWEASGKYGWVITQPTYCLCLSTERYQK